MKAMSDSLNKGNDDGVDDKEWEWAEDQGNSQGQQEIRRER